MREITCSTITDAIKKMCIEAATILPQDVEKALSQKHDEEDSALAKKTLQVLMDNAKLAQEKQMPICQDTGMAFVYVTMGQEVHITGGSLNEAIQEGVRQGYTEGYLRKSVVKILCLNALIQKTILQQLFIMILLRGILFILL